MDDIKSAYKKGMVNGYKQGVEDARKALKMCERDPKDNTRLSLAVDHKLDALIERCD